MNRRGFLKLIAVATFGFQCPHKAPYLPISTPMKVIEKIGLNKSLQRLFDYTMQNMVFTDFMGRDENSLIKIIPKGD